MMKAHLAALGTLGLTVVNVMLAIHYPYVMAGVYIFMGLSFCYYLTYLHFKRQFKG